MSTTDQPTVTPVVLDVTPDQAQSWLTDRNTHNRHLRAARIEAYARDMTAGQWQFNGDPIRFSGNGVLLDGQHRLSAVAQAGVTIKFLVLFGLPESTQETMDIGAHRQMADALTLRGETNSAFLAAIARRVVMYDAGARSGGGTVVPTHAEMGGYIDAHPEIRRSVEVARLARQAGLPVAPSVIGTAYEICARVSKDAAETFYVEQVTDGLGLLPGDPALTFRRRVQQDSATGRPMAVDDAFRYLLVAWNHFRAKRQITKLQAPKGGWTAKNFPVPQ